jgi:hypothetical protein
LSKGAVAEFRVAQDKGFTDGTWVEQSLTGFTSAPWNGTSARLWQPAWRPHSECEEGIIVGGQNSTTFGIVARFQDSSDPDCP